MKYELREYQERAVDAIWDYFEHEEGNPLVILPTGSGKSLVLAAFIERAITTYPGTRCLVLSHVKEIVAQDAEKLEALLPWGHVGVYSASMRRKELGYPVTVANVQSIVNAKDKLGEFDLVFVDEAHMVPEAGEGRYRTLLGALRATNPYLKVIGLTATAFRMKSGLLVQGEGAIFTDVAIEIGIKELIASGYLSRLRSKTGNTQGDVSGLKISKGDFVQSEAEIVMMNETVVQGALDECELYGHDRKSWIVFCAGIDHAIQVTNELNKRDIASAMVSGKTNKADRELIIDLFRRQKIRAIVNVNVLTIGFDAPCVDLVVLLRPTKSPGLYVQMIGRGMRLSPDTGKENCLVLDFAHNIAEHGPIDQVTVSASSGEKMEGFMEGEVMAPQKICPECREMVPIQTRVCEICSYTFPFVEQAPHDVRAAAADIISSDDVSKRWSRVHSVKYEPHFKEGSPTSMKVTYQCFPDGGAAQQFREWICIEHQGIAARLARLWWKRSAETPVPKTISEALERRSELRVPSAISTVKKGRYYEITDYRWEQ